MKFSVFLTYFCIELLYFTVPNVSAFTDHMESFDLKNIPVLEDTSAIEITLYNFSSVNKDNDLVEQFITLSSSSEIEIIVKDIPEVIKFLLVQAHSYENNITLSYNVIPTLGTSVIGTNIGLIKYAQSNLWKHLKSVSLYLTNDSKTQNVTVLITVQGFRESAPVPGGCNMEFHVEIAPYLQTTVDKDIIQVDFALASLADSTLDSISVSSEDMCEIKPSPISYDIYQLYLPEQDLSVDTYFLYLRKMMSVNSVKEYSGLIRESGSDMLTRRKFAAYPGLGRVVVVVAHTLTDSAVYVPSLTYAFNKSGPSHYEVSTTLAQILCAVILFLGLFSCFMGHWFFKTHLFLIGLLSGGLVTYILLYDFYNFDDEDELLLTSFAGGLMFGLFWLLFWCCFSVPVLTILLSTTVLGYLLASTLFYAFADMFTFLEDDTNYAAVFGSLVLIVPIVFLSLNEVANVISCAVLGAYVALMPVDLYIGSNLRFIIVNSIRRATIGRFNTAVIHPPFQTRDALLGTAWIFLVICGYKLQRCILKDKAPFPSSPNFLSTLLNCCKSRRVRSRQLDNETSPLLDEHYWYEHTVPEPPPRWPYPEWNYTGVENQRVAVPKPPPPYSQRGNYGAVYS